MSEQKTPLFRYCLESGFPPGDVGLRFRVEICFLFSAKSGRNRVHWSVKLYTYIVQVHQWILGQFFLGSVLSVGKSQIAALSTEVSQIVDAGHSVPQWCIQVGEEVSQQRRAQMTSVEWLRNVRWTEAKHTRRKWEGPASRPQGMFKMYNGGGGAADINSSAKAPEQKTAAPPSLRTHHDTVSLSPRVKTITFMMTVKELPENYLYSMTTLSCSGNGSNSALFVFNLYRWEMPCRPNASRCWRTLRSISWIAKKYSLFHKDVWDWHVFHFATDIRSRVCEYAPQWKVLSSHRRRPRCFPRYRFWPSHHDPAVQHSNEQTKRKITRSQSLCVLPQCVVVAFSGKETSPTFSASSMERLMSCEGVLQRAPGSHSERFAIRNSRGQPNSGLKFNQTCK